MKRLVLFVEGQGEMTAAPALVGRLMTGLPEFHQSQFYLDSNPFRVGGAHAVTGQRSPKFTKYLSAALQREDNLHRKDLGAVLVILDGDADAVEGQPFCAGSIANILAERGRDAGAGALFSLGIVFLRQEYESMLIAVADQLPGFDTGVERPADVETAPRDAKGWLDKNLAEGYRSSTDQVRLTQAVTNWTPARALRSFRRLEHALTELAEAVASEQHIVSPRRIPPQQPIS